MAQVVLLKPVMPENFPRRDLDSSKPFVWSSLWTAVRGEQVINCELIVTGTGKATLRCEYGTGAVIRSQCTPSASAAVALSDTWQSALVQQGFRVVPRIELSLSPIAVGAASVAEDWHLAGANVPAASAARGAA
jgi:hypothetical protein